MNDSLPKAVVNEFFKRLRSYNCNSKCADCNKKTPIWTSLTFSVFICAECATKHREMGVTITKVKNTVLDSWTLPDLRRMSVGGNERALVLPQTLDIFEKYRVSKWYSIEIDELVTISEEKMPNDEFLKVKESVKPRGNRNIVIEEKEPPKLGSAVSHIPTESFEKNNENAKIQTKKDKSKEKQESVCFVNISTASSGLQKADTPSYKLTDSSNLHRVGLGNVQVETEEDKGRYSYKCAPVKHVYVPKSKNEKDDVVKDTIKKIALGGKSVIGNIVNKFNKK
ncbi:ADP-ribosylation factor GTPase-activating protein [Hamiltosporidium magnivora]|uniref:ADP-ribosylation factor GTPase-activating protein n=1 Tax=Hamiltosporidium magnivora TaxID=148818 RepID=A0A4Q9L1F1_9MICR|nr:ADP-ribosylation factor GTPase-activating protein [Hamiltosporidium magnivora]TBU09024.1 ADP-ribosylation factor GTPase-activating protein [Hamiltosporidium magnivora]